MTLPFLDDPDWGVRLAAFAALDRLCSRLGPVLTWAEIAEGFDHQGERVLFANKPRGIFRPVVMRAGALSVKTNVPRAGREARYDDQVASDEGFFTYCYQGAEVDAWDNRALAETYRLGAPLIYFYGVAPGLYRPLYPVFLQELDGPALTCRIAVDQPGLLGGDAGTAAIRRAYVTVEAKKRLHQDAFRALVLRAYATRCAICNLPGTELVEAAHIVPDRDERGRPEVPNGMALCRLHHGAYDRNLIGIRGDYVVQVSQRLMREKDGPVLEFGIKAFHDKEIHLPSRCAERPVPEFLAERFGSFEAA